jgi:DNA polymerase sigma
MLFTQHPSLQVLCLILKDLLRVSNLNKPYIGGISSYVLVVLVYNILMRKEVAIDQDLARQMRTVATYLSTEFKPYVTLVTAFKDSELKASE